MRRVTLLLACLPTAAAVAQTPDNTLWATNFSSSAGIRSISKIDPSGFVIGSTTISTSFTPFGLAVDPLGAVWAGSNGTTVAKVDVNGAFVNTYPVGSFPQSVASDASGNIWVANRGSDSVTKLSNAGASLGTFPVAGGTSPIGIIVHPSGNVWVSGFGSSTTHSLFELNAGGTIVNTFSFTTANSGFGFSFPAVEDNVLRQGDVWVANQARVSIMQIDAAGNIRSETPITTGLPRGAQIDGLGFCWLANQGFAGACLKIDQTGAIVGTFLPPSTSFTTCAIDGNGDPWVFGFSSGKAIKLWQVDATPLVEVPVPSGGSAWGGDVGAYHLAMNVIPNGDFDGDNDVNFTEILAGTNPFDANSTTTNPLPILSGVPTRGSTVNLSYRFRGDANKVYIAALSLSGDSPGFNLPDGRNVPLNIPLAILNFGVLNGTGDDRRPLPIPVTAPAGINFWVAYVTLDAAAPSGVQTVSNALQATIQ